MKTMKVLVVASGVKKGKATAVVANQMESLKKQGVAYDFYLISGSGLMGYLKAIPQIRTAIKNGKYDLIHAHYSLCGFSAALAFSGVPVVCSLMGSDLSRRRKALVVRFFEIFLWTRTIVKSDGMLAALGTKSKADVIPNGVNLEHFRPWNEAPRVKNFSPDHYNVLFLAESVRPEKNYSLACQAVELLQERKVKLWQVEGIDPTDIPDCIRSADVVLLTSLREGSPNVVKEALACNVPVVATDVGDVRKLLSGVRACHVAAFDSHDVAAKILLALEDKNRCDGRDAIKRLSLDSDSVSRRILDLYQDCLVDE